jgi:4-hydroxybenzoate polyprenyltransferase
MKNISEKLTTIRIYISGLGRLIRFPNLLIIILTQFLLRYCILEPLLYSESGSEMSGILDFSILVTVTILITIGGYIINDYFDVKIDSVNKPDRLVIDKLIPARSAILMHLIINGVATILGFYLAYRVGSVYFGLIFPFISVLLWFYSVRYKRMLLWGNLVVAFLSSFVILVVWLYEFFYLRAHPVDFANVIPDLKAVTNIFLAYALFAFLVSLFREIVKDMEDWEGDEKYGCRTLPLVIGLEKTKWVAASIMVINMVLLGDGLFILNRMGQMLAFWYFLAIIEIPVVFLIYFILKAKTKPEYHTASLLTKLLMLAGILSMQVITLTY